MSESPYVRALELAWQAAHLPREADAPTVISTFAGCGGSSLGYAMAGYRELLAVEWDKHACEVFRLNFPDVPVYQGDIAALSVDECMRLAGVKRGELDVLDGSPPCQGFSTAGKRQLDDPRNQLFREFVRLLDGLQPKAFVMENVSGMVKGQMKQVFVEALDALEACGYRVAVRLLNAKHFGVPQSRERLIFVGVRNDLGVEPSFPAASTGGIVLRDAAGDLPDDGPVVTGSRAFVQSIPQGSGNGGFKFYPKHFGVMRLHPGAVSPTLTKQDGRHAHPDGKRWLSIDAAKRVGSFPDGFAIPGGYGRAWARIGNSVPPLLMRAIARHVRQILQAASQRPQSDAA